MPELLMLQLLIMGWEWNPLVGENPSYSDDGSDSEIHKKYN